MQELLTKTTPTPGEKSAKEIKIEELKAMMKLFQHPDFQAEAERKIKRLEMVGQ